VQIHFNLYIYNNVNLTIEILQQTHTHECKTEEERDNIYVGKTLTSEKPHTPKHSSNVLSKQSSL